MRSKVDAAARRYFESLRVCAPERVQRHLLAKLAREMAREAANGGDSS